MPILEKASQKQQTFDFYSWCVALVLRVPDCFACLLCTELANEEALKLLPEEVRVEVSNAESGSTQDFPKEMKPVPDSLSHAILQLEASLASRRNQAYM